MRQPLQVITSGCVISFEKEKNSLFKMISRNDKDDKDVFNDVVEYVEKNEPTFILHSNDGYMTKVNKVSKYVHI